MKRTLIKTITATVLASTLAGGQFVQAAVINETTTITPAVNEAKEETATVTSDKPQEETETVNSNEAEENDYSAEKGATVKTYKTEKGSFTYEIQSNGTIYLYGYKGTDEKLVIPEKIEDRKVTLLGSIITSGYTNGYIKEIVIPSTVTTIYEDFNGMTNLTKITVSSSNPSYSSADGILFNKNKTELLVSPRKVALTKYTIPSTVKKVAGFAFEGSCIKEIYMPDSVTYMGSYVFRNSAITKIRLSNNIDDISMETFKNSKLTSIVIPSKVYVISASAFSGCKDLVSISLPDSLKTIWDDVFTGCSSLSNITIPKNVEGIGARSFVGCSKLTSINVNSANQKFCSVDGVLYNKSKSTLKAYPEAKIGSSYTAPSTLTTISMSAFKDNKSLKTINLNNGLKTIGAFAFQGCTNLGSIKIPNTVTTLDGFALADSGISSVVLSESLTKLEWNLFQNTKNLTSVTVPKSVKDISLQVFDNCPNLKSVTVLNKDTTFSYTSVQKCPNLTLYGYAGSTTEKYAKQIGKPFKTITAGPIVSSFTADKVSPQEAGTRVTLKATASGTGTLQYKFVIRDDKCNYFIIKNYSTSNTVTWTTGAVGNKLLFVDVKDSTGKVVRKEMTYKVTPKSTLAVSSFTADKASPQETGTEVTLKATASGTGTLQYKFLIRDAAGNWAVLRDYETSNTYLWLAKIAGNKTLYVDVKDSTGKIVRKAMNYTVK